MKIQFSLPKNEAFFNRYATLIPTLSKLGVIAQIISALTEVGIIYSILLTRLIGMAPQQANIIAIIGAIIGTLFLEIGLRKFTPYSIRAFLYKRFSGLDLAMTVFIVSVNVGLFFASGVLSFKGSKELVKIATPPTELKAIDGVADNHSSKLKALQSTFVSDSTTVAKGFKNQIRAERNKYRALVEEQETILKRYQGKEKRTGKSYQTRKENAIGKIAKLRTEQTKSIAHLESQQAKQLLSLVTLRKTQTSSTDSIYYTGKDQIEKANEAILFAANQTTTKYGFGLAWFTVICLLVLIFSIVINEIHKKGSGIEQVAIPNQYHFSQSILSDFSNVYGEKVNYFLRSKIDRLAATIPPPPLPQAPPSLYDLAAAKQQRLAFTLPKHEEKIYVLDSKPLDLKGQATEVYNDAAIADKAIKPKKDTSDLENIILQYLKAFLDLQKCNLTKESKEMELKAEQVIKAYLGEQATAENVTKLKDEIIGFINGENSNPFETHHRNPIGFNKPVNNIKNNTIRKTYNDTPEAENRRLCAHCSKAYTYRHHKQKYCCDGCRIEAWEQRTGKTLKMKKKK